MIAEVFSAAHGEVNQRLFMHHSSLSSLRMFRPFTRHTEQRRTFLARSVGEESGVGLDPPGAPTRHDSELKALAPASDFRSRRDRHGIVRIFEDSSALVGGVVADDHCA